MHLSFRDLRERFVLNGHEDSDGEPLALVFAQEHGAGLEAPGAIRSALVASCKAVEMLCGLRIKSTLGPLLDVPADEADDEVLGEALRCRRTERHPPQGAKLVEVERPNAVDLGLDCFAIG